MTSRRPVARSTPDELHVLAAGLRAARLGQQVTQAAIANKLGVTPAAIAGWEHGRDWPSCPNFLWWAECLGFEVRIIDDRGVRLIPAMPVPKAGGEESHHYGFRCVALTLRERRLDLDLSQEDVAEKLRVSTWAIDRWENSGRTPFLPNLIAWCHPLRCRLTISSR